MLEIYRNRMRQWGTSIGETHRLNAEMILNETFTNDTAYRQVKINGELADAKYIKHTEFSILKDKVDYYLQFRPRVHFPVGTFVDIPDDSDNYKTWLIMDSTNDNQFVRYLVLECNHVFKWMNGNKVMSCLGCIRNRNSYNSGVWSSMYSTSPENQIAAWFPTNDTVRTITYDKRFMISDNIIYPLCFEVTKIEDMVPRGITKITFKQDQFNERIDNAELMIADYYKSNLPAEDMEETPVNTLRIVHNGTFKDLKCGGSYKTYRAVYEKDSFAGELTWNLTVPPGLNASNFETLAQNDGSCKVRVLKDISLIGKVVTLNVSDEEGISSSLNLEVIAL